MESNHQFATLFFTAAVAAMGAGSRLARAVKGVTAARHDMRLK